MAWFPSLFRKKKSGAEPPAEGAEVRLVSGAKRTKPRIWAVGGGKGGVGKSLVASNFGIYLSKFAKRVLLVDADFGAANLHTIVGGEEPRFTLSAYLKGGFDDIRSLIRRTDVPCLDLLGGSKDSSDAADLRGSGMVRLRAALRDLDYDYIIIDTGPGTAANLLDIFLTAGRGILVTTPEPTAIENTHRFLRCVYLRRIRQLMAEEEDGGLGRILREVLSGPEASRPRTLAGVLRAVKDVDADEGQRLTETLNGLGISIIVNQTTSEEDSDLGDSMVRVWLDYFGMNVSFLGQITRDDMVSTSVRSRRPLALSLGYSGAAWDLKKCIIKLLEEEKQMTPHLRAIL